MTAVAANYNINMTKVTTNNKKIDALQSPELDALLKTLKDEKFWKSTVDDKNKIKLGAAAALALALARAPPPPSPPSPPPSPPRAPRAPAPAPGADLPIPEPVNPNDPQGIDVAKWAAAEYGREYLKLLGGLKWDLVVGTLYALFINNQDANHQYTSGAVVAEIPLIGRTLLLWIDILSN